MTVFEEHESLFPPADHVVAARNDERLQADNAGEVEEARRANPELACAKCGSTELAWFYFSSPPVTWENLCGTAGAMAVCDDCQRRVEYFETMIN